jgi:nitroreductase
MDILQVIRERRSIRSFKAREIPPEALQALEEALIWAPSAGNLQARRFFFVTQRPLKEALAVAALGQSFVAQAPLVVVGCADHGRIAPRYGRRGVELYAVQDVACSLMCMMLQAHALGLGTVWVGAFREEEAAKALGLPPELRPVALVPVGYPEHVPRSAPPRLPKEELIFYL